MQRILCLSLVAVSGVLSAQAPSRKVFDPGRDPQRDLALAETEAARANKNILLDIGGNWCASCLLLDSLLHSQPDLERLLSAGFIVVHVNVSPENLNRDFLSRFPPASGYPFLIVLSPTGRHVLHFQDGRSFQSTKDARGYDPIAIHQFLEEWRKLPAALSP